MTPGVLVRGILVDVGDVALDQVSLESSGMKFLRDYRLTSDVEEAVEADNELLTGVTIDGFTYSRGAVTRPDSTYLLRSAAYRGSLYRAYEGISYDEFKFDKRRDIIVAFRIARSDVDGTITIIWRELDNRQSPSIQWPRKTGDGARENKFIGGN